MCLQRTLYIKPFSFFALLFLLIASLPLQAQKDIKIAEQKYERGLYAEAIPFFSRHLNAWVDPKALLLRGKCYYQTDQLKAAIEDFERAQLLKYSEPEIDYYLAKSWHHLGEWDRAAEQYKRYMSWYMEDDFIRQRITDEVKRCASGIRLAYSSPRFDVQNFGPPVNTSANELNLISSPSRTDTYYFSRSDPGRDDRYRIGTYQVREAVMDENTWLNPAHENLNELIADISPDGQQMYLSRRNDKKKRNTLWVDGYSPDKAPLSRLKRFEGPVEFEKGDRDLYLVDDSTFLFSSDRAGGYGGYDLYLTGFRNGNWFLPVNLGGRINSPYDEITPASGMQGTLLVFSSNRVESVGGFDVFFARLDSTGAIWQDPENAGLPLNSPGDEINFRFTGENEPAVFASDRKTGGFGKFDIYQAIPLSAVESVSNTNAWVTGVLGNTRIRPAGKVSEEYTGKPVVETTGTDLPTDPEPKEIQDNPFLVEIDQQVASETVVSSGPVIKGSGPVDSLSLENLFYQPETSLISQPEVNAFIRQLAQVLIRHPDSHLALYAHGKPEASRWESLIQTVAELEAFVDLLVGEGIPPDHIRIIGVGTELPIAKTGMGDRLENASQKFNHRLECRIQAGSESLQVSEKSPFVVQHLRSDSWYLYRSLLEGLSYSLVLDRIKPGENPTTPELPEPWLLEKDFFRNEFTLQSGLFKHYGEAKSIRHRLPPALAGKIRIQAMIDGWPVPEKDVLSYAGKYTDLINYLADR